MSSNNAQNICDIQTNTRFVKTDECSDSTLSMGLVLNGSSTYYDNDNPYDQYMAERTENSAMKKQIIQDEGDDMNNNEILHAYMDKVDKDQRDLKNEMRERENRVEQNIRDSEQRMDVRLDRIENMISVQNEKIEKMISNQNEKIEKLSDKFDQSVKEIKSNKLQIWATVIATILAVAGIAFASLQVVQGFISLVHLQ